LLTIAIVLTSFAVKSTEEKTNLNLNPKLVVALDTAHYNYFLHKGHPTGYQIELFNLFAEHKGIEIDFRLVPDSSKLTMLCNGEIDLAVFSEGFDSLYSVFNSQKNICASLPLDEHIKSVWLSRETNADLILSVNMWISTLKEESLYRFLQIKYFERTYSKTNKISIYDSYIEKHSNKIDWDWKLVAALIYQESMFRNDVVSKRGATGLMQLMPQTAERFGVNNINNPEENIKGGIKLIGYLIDYFEKKGIEQDEIVYFVLAAYNAGHGRIENCMAVANMLGLNQYKWSEVNSAISLMRNPNKELSSIILGSKFNGKETINFVDNIIKRYQHYQHFFS